MTARTVARVRLRIKGPSETHDDGTHDNGARSAATGSEKGSPRFVVPAAASVLGLLVVAPWIGRGFVVLLDWPIGPHPPWPRAASGFLAEAPGSLPFNIAITLAGQALGGIASWLPILLFFPIAATGAARLVGGNLLQRSAAGCLYSFAPVVYERVYAGQLAYLLGYAVLPWFAVCVFERPRRVAPAALLLGLLGALTVHALWIGAALLLSVLLIDRGRGLGWAAGVLAGAAGCNAYLLHWLLSGRDYAPGVDELGAFAAASDESVGLYGNVAALYGFWRDQVALPKGDSPGWVFLLALLLAVIGLGAWDGWKQGNRRLVAGLGLAGAFGYLLSLGDQGPTGALFRFAFKSVPGFSVMREPQKFIALTALAYAVLFALGAARLARTFDTNRTRVAIGALVLTLPLAYNPSLFWGISGRVDATSYPASWHAADRAMGDGEGAVLFLPWHQYTSFEFTGNRIVAGPADAVFRRSVVSSQDPELPGVEAPPSRAAEYLEFLFSHGHEIRSFGRLAGPLGVEYIALADAADSGSYSWLASQTDLTPVFDGEGLTVWRNDAWRGAGIRATRVLSADHWGNVVDLANQGQTDGAAVVTRRNQPGPITPTPEPAPRPHIPQDLVDRASPHRYTISKKARAVLVGEEHDAGWDAAGGTVKSSAAGSLLLENSRGDSTLRYQPYERLRVLFVLSLLCVVGLIAYWQVHPHDKKRKAVLDA